MDPISGFSRFNLVRPQSAAPSPGCFGQMGGSLENPGKVDGDQQVGLRREEMLQRLMSFRSDGIFDRWQASRMLPENPIGTAPDGEVENPIGRVPPSEGDVDGAQPRMPLAPDDWRPSGVLPENPIGAAPDGEVENPIGRVPPSEGDVDGAQPRMPLAPDGWQPSAVLPSAPELRLAVQSYLDIADAR